MTVPYITPAADVAPLVWLPLGDEWISLPWQDSRTSLYARTGYSVSRVVCEREGAELVTRDDMIELRAAGLVLPAVALPDAAQLAAAGIHRHDYPPGEEGDPAYQAAVGVLRNAHMRSEEWARYHDAKVADLLAEAKWDGSRPVLGIGKQWVKGRRGARVEYPPHGTAWLMGWPHMHDAGWTQTGESAESGAAGFHDAGDPVDPARPGYSDYSSIALAKRKTPPEAT